MTHYEPELFRMTKDIEQYLVEHPNASDTLEGITMWWLQRQRLLDTLESILHALDDLIDRGLVKKSMRMDGENIYVSTLSQENFS